MAPPPSNAGERGLAFFMTPHTSVMGIVQA
jgi:hypothetical protein